MYNTVTIGEDVLNLPPSGTVIKDRDPTIAGFDIDFACVS